MYSMTNVLIFPRSVNNVQLSVNPVGHDRFIGQHALLEITLHRQRLLQYKHC